MTLEDYEIFEYKAYPNTDDEIVKFCLIMISIIICCIILITIIRSYYKTQSKDSNNNIAKNTLVTNRTKQSKLPKTVQNKKKCSKCENWLAKDALFCHKCGQAKNSRERFCAYCGKDIVTDAVFCDTCGNKF